MSWKTARSFWSTTTRVWHDCYSRMVRISHLRSSISISLPSTTTTIQMLLRTYRTQQYVSQGTRLVKSNSIERPNNSANSSIMFGPLASQMPTIVIKILRNAYKTLLEAQKEYQALP